MLQINRLISTGFPKDVIVELAESLLTFFRQRPSTLVTTLGGNLHPDQW